MHYPVDPDDMQPHALASRRPRRTRRRGGHARRRHVRPPVAEKGYRELVRAAAFVLRTNADGPILVLRRRPAAARAGTATAQSLGIADRFKLFGFRRDVPDLMQAIDVMCLPSHREPFGLVYVEAALAEKPVIACHAGGAPEIIVHGETGLLVPPPRKRRGRSPRRFSHFSTTATVPTRWAAAAAS